jgi:NAD(P)-dependent dehydrogenase (short-subunit alcohol dehydrogenase family)
MQIKGRKVVVLGGSGLVGLAVCRELLEHQAREVRIHSLRLEEAEEASQELTPHAGETLLTVSGGDIFGLAESRPRLERIAAQLRGLTDENMTEFLLYRLLQDTRPDIVIDCVNTATAIAYTDIYRASEKVRRQLSQLNTDSAAVEDLLEALYIPRLIRHIQLLYRGMTDAGTRVYIKVGTSGTGGMGLNIPYTHSEEKPSRVLLSKSAVAGAHSMLLFLMARSPGAPITKEIKPAAAIAWKKIAWGPIARKGQQIHLMKALPKPLGARQMEFVTPEEIAQYLIFEIEGGNTGHDIINALDNAVLGPTYRAGLMRHWALERMIEFERQGDSRSVAFEMLGPPRNSKLLFEAHLLRETFGTMTALRESTPQQVTEALNRLVRDNPKLANEVVSVGIPILLDSGELIRGTSVILPAEADREAITPEKLESWVEAGWVDLRGANCARWIERFQAIHDETAAIPEEDTSSRHLRNRRFWDEAKQIQPGKIVGFILSVEEQGARIKR